MKITFDPHTDSLYIQLSERPSVESREIAEGIVVDFDEAGQVVGIDLEHAGSKVDLRHVELCQVLARDVKAA